MTQYLNSCPVCGNQHFHDYLECEDFTVTKERFILNECDACGFVFTNPRPTIGGIGAYYQSEDYISHTNSNKGIKNKAYQWVRRRAIRSKLSMIEEQGTLPKTLLDYGCGTGEFLGYAQASGWLVKGLELDPEARARAIMNHKIDVKDPTQLYAFSDGQFGAITMWHVMEHIHDLVPTIREFHRILSSEGVMIIAVPNYKSTDAGHYGPFWAAYDVPRHLYHFSKSSVSLLMEKNGFKVKAVNSLFFDPFYISLLSEKYKNGWSNPIKAAWIGLKTTLKGRKNIEANSSLVYIVKKSS
ncbi:class I SAM-dependent methyltransferase [soil metagenome]